MWWLAALGLACNEPPGKAPATPSGPSVIVLVIDGVRTDELCGTEPSELSGVAGDALAPDIWAQLAPDARLSRAALNTGVTITAPAHAALVTGRNETYGNFSVEEEGPGVYRPFFPTIFEAARSSGASEDEVLLVANTPLLEGLTESAVPAAPGGARWTFVPHPDGGAGRGGEDDGVFDELMREVMDGPPRLVVANLHDVDRAGHYSDAPAYPKRITTVDDEIADFWAWVHAEHPAYAEELLLVVTADHGRHRNDTEESWRNHGDACDGCRELPLFVVGPGVDPGEFASPPLAIDLTPTIAAHVGFAMPWAEGLPYEGVAGEGPVRSGEFSVARSGGTIAAQVWTEDAAARSEVRVDDALVSTPGALGAEAPVVLEASVGRLACWRELADTGADRPWVPRCLADTGEGFVDIGFPAAAVSPFWRVSLGERGGAVWAAWADNPYGVVEHPDGEVNLAVAKWTPADGWSTPALLDSWFPTDAALAVNDDALAVAYATNLEDPIGRYTRRIRVVPYAVEGGLPVPSATTDFARDGARFEHPALAADGVRLRLAMLVLTPAGASIETATSEDGGATWTTPAPLAGSDAVSPHLPLAWDGADVVWGAMEGEDALLCRAAPGASEPACVDVGSPRLQSFSVQDGVATIIRDADVATWERAELTW